MTRQRHYGPSDTVVACRGVQCIGLKKLIVLTARISARLGGMWWDADVDCHTSKSETSRESGEKEVRASAQEDVHIGCFCISRTTMKQCIRQGTGQGTSMLEGLHVSHCHCPRRKSTVQGKHADIKAKKDPASIHVHSDLLRVKQAAH